MTCPIQPYVSSVFVHVSDLKRSTEWYSRLLGLPIKPERVNGGPIYWFDLDYQTGLILDDNRNNKLDEKHPLFMFNTNDTKAAYDYVKSKGIQIQKKYYEDPAVSFFNFIDSEGNVVMVCGPGAEQQIDPDQQLDSSKQDHHIIETSSPVKSKIGNVFVNVTDLKRATEWYSELLQLPIKPENESGYIYEIRMKKGADLLLDVNRRLQNQDYQILFMFDTDDIDSAYAYLLENDIPIFTGIERYEAVSFFTFLDPDQNVLMVCQSHE